MFAENHAAFLIDFGENVTLNGASVRVIFDDDYVEPLGVESSGPAVSLWAADAVDVVHGQVLVRAGATYKVRGVRPIDVGWLLLKLERQ